MDISAILQAIDQQIDQLQQARALLTESEPAKRGPGRARLAEIGPSEPPAPKKRTMSAAGRARIAAAQKARWAVRNSEDKAATKTPTTSAKKSARAPKKITKGPKKNTASAKKQQDDAATEA